jgi:hypothetical protein
MKSWKYVSNEKAALAARVGAIGFSSRRQTSATTCAAASCSAKKNQT